jgi:hypothetical protein
MVVVALPLYYLLKLCVYDNKGDIGLARVMRRPRAEVKGGLKSTFGWSGPQTPP